DEVVEPGRSEVAPPPASEETDDGMEQGARQGVGGGLEVVQVEEDGSGLFSPPVEAGEEGALADAGLSPQNGAEAAARPKSLPGQGGETLEGEPVDVGHVHGSRSWTVDAVLEEGVGAGEAVEEPFEGDFVGHEPLLAGCCWTHSPYRRARAD